MLKKYLIMLCYSRYNSMRIMKTGSQNTDELWQFAFVRITHEH
ncbi:MAG: hypothetical protein Q4F95_02645 [Oscillospiraceae bacterium]|nr:hypothetical protein [Oscillospiraceae bacterium]